MKSIILAQGYQTADNTANSHFKNHASSNVLLAKNISNVPTECPKLHLSYNRI